MHQSTFSVYALKRQIQPALKLAFETLQSPALRKDDFSRLQRQKQAALLQTLGTPKKLAARLARPLTFGRDHPYSQLPTPDSINAITPENTRKALSLFNTKHTTLFIAGSLTEDEVRSLLEPHLTTYAAPKVQFTLPDARPDRQKIFAVHIQGAPQSQLRVMRPSRPRNHPNYVATTLATRILGGSFSSRLNMNLREDKGYAYGARASTSYTRDTGFLIASSSVKTSTSGDSLREIAKELRAICTDNPPTADELKREQNNWILSLPSRFATSQSTLGAYANLAYYNLPFDTYAKLPTAIREAKPQDLQNAAKDTLCSEDLSAYVVLVIGNLDAIQSDLQSLVTDKIFGERTIQRLTPLGKPAPKQ